MTSSSVPRSALVTGGSRGIGLAVARALVREGVRVALIARGCSNEEVGERLGISPRTAKAHCDVLRQKLGVPRRRQIPAAFKTLTGEDPLARELAPALAGAGG